MEIQIAQLRDILGILKPVVPRKPALTVLKNVLVKEGQVVATDLDSMVIINLPEADEPFLLPFAEVLTMLQYVPGYDYLKLHAKGGQLTLTWPEGSATYPSQDLEDFPPVPDFEVKTEADIDGDSFIGALSSALPYAATESDRPVLNGVTVVFGKPIEISAGDGFRMAHIVLPLQFPEERTTILPSSSVSILKHVLQKTPRTPPQGDALVPILVAKRQIKVALDEKRGLKVVFGPTASVIIKLVEGTPPSWLKLIPKGEPVLKVQLFAREFEAAVRRVTGVATLGTGVVRLQFENGTARVSAKADGQEVSANVAVLASSGENNRLGLNVSYLAEYLRNKDGIVSMAWNGDTSPVSFKHKKDPNVLIMPMQVDWGKEQPVAQAEPEPVSQTEPEPDPSTAVPGASPSKPKKQRGKKNKG